MRKFFAIALLAAFVFFAVPYAAVRLLGGTSFDAQVVRVYNISTGEIIEETIGEYLFCTVAAEMPAEFEPEALKAQAVAARTYLCRKMQSEPSSPEHNGADICTDHTHCSAYKSLEELKAYWDRDYRKYARKIKAAVKSTDGIVMTYGGEPISAVYHSTSSGRTENAADVWGGEVPYLVSVASDWDEASPEYRSQAVFTGAEITDILRENYPDFDEKAPLIGNFKKSEAGGIIYITMGGVQLKGTELRTLFGLRSTNVVVTENNGRYYFSVKGYGHGVGMSQYGAEYMAKDDAAYEDILSHYYTGIEFTSLADSI